MRTLFLWLGGAIFVASLAACAYSYLVVWGRVEPYAGRAAVAVDVAWFTLFAAHHSVLARAAMQRRIERIVAPRLMRSVYVWTASLLLIVACVMWQPVGGDVYHAAGWPALACAAVQLSGLGLIAFSVRAIDPLELAGIHDPVQRSTLQITGPYRWVRHPLYLGWMLAVFGAAHMTGDRLAFAAISSIYLILAVPWEEQSLRRSFEAEYAAYARTVRWRIIPFVY
jgi:methanethiol S-methyltransferase